ncbi:MAG TPA: hypothetical protein VK590_13580 [Saprospiraceae bacterium]|nr:hypothetical protein [Saprospiraceae bacterium]
MNKIAYLILGFVLITASLASAQKYQLKVGNLVIGLKMVSGPHVYNGRTEVYKDEAIENLKGPVVLLKDGVPMYGKKIIFYYLPTKRDQGSNLISTTLELAKDVKIPEDIQKQIADKLDINDNITVQSTGPEESISLNSAALFIKDPSAPYKPPVYPSYNNENDVFSFQLVGGLSKTLLKVDSNVVSNKKIVAIYKDKKKYDIMHIPGYRTKNRYVKITDSFWDPDEISNTVDLSKLKLKPWYLYPEIAIETEYACSAKWGKMNAAPLSQNHALDVFKENMNNPLEISIPKDQVTLYHFEMIIVPDRGETTKYICDSITDPKVQEVLGKVGDRSAIYFQNLMVKNATGEVLYMPLTFGFLIASK